MSGPAESKIEIEAKVYIHKRDPSTRSKIPHIDIEAPILNEIIKPNESTFVSGKLGLLPIILGCLSFFYF
jgi:hypothetical protein